MYLCACTVEGKHTSPPQSTNSAVTTHLASSSSLRSTDKIECGAETQSPRHQHFDLAATVPSDEYIEQESPDVINQLKFSESQMQSQSKTMSDTMPDTMSVPDDDSMADHIPNSTLPDTMPDTMPNNVPDGMLDGF